MACTTSEEEKQLRALWAWRDAVNEWYSRKPKWYAIKSRIAWRRMIPQTAEYFQDTSNAFSTLICALGEC